MSESDLAFGQRVTWRTASGAQVPARVVDILPGKGQIQIRVVGDRGMRHFWVRPEALDKESPNVDS